MLTNDEKECVLLAIEYFLKKDEEFELVNGWTVEHLKSAWEKLGGSKT